MEQNLPRKYYMPYDEISFLIIDDSVAGITALSRRYKFTNGVGVGDSEQKVKENFGNEFHLEEFKVKDLLTYEKEGLVFEIRNDNKTVVEIDVAQKAGDRGKNDEPSGGKVTTQSKLPPGPITVKVTV